MGRCAILLEYEVVSQQTVTVLDELMNQIIHVEIFIHLHFHVWGAMLQRYKVFTPNPTNKAKLMAVLQAIWED